MRMQIALATSARLISLSGSKLLREKRMRCSAFANAAYGAYQTSVETSSNTENERLSSASG